MIGSFHLICAYLKMIGKKMNESGLADVLLEAGLICWFHKWCHIRKKLQSRNKWPQSHG